MQKCRQQIKVKTDSKSINFNVRCFAIIGIQENVWSFCDVDLSLHDLYFVIFLTVINFSSSTRVLLGDLNSLKSSTQSTVMLTCNLAKINSGKKWHVPCLKKEIPFWGELVLV